MNCPHGYEFPYGDEQIKPLCPYCDNAALRAKVAELESANAALTERVGKLEAVLNMNKPYPLTFVLEEFALMSEHLHNHHNCDCLGYEGRLAAVDAAREIRAAALAATSGTT